MIAAKSVGSFDKFILQLQYHVQNNRKIKQVITAQFYQATP